MNPKLLIIMETELWPNLINVTSSLGVKLILANARLSEKSATGYATFRSVTRRMLAKIDFIGAQSESDARRLVELGAKEKGKLRLEGKDYPVKDGDIIHFKFNV